MIWLQLFYVYLKIGIFGFGGGYAMLSLIQADVVDRYGWISSQEFTDIVAISQMTPGPIGINSATYIGYTAIHNAGYSPAMAVFGSCLTTFAVCLPSFLLVLAISYAFAKFRNNKYVAAAFYGLRPATVGLIAAAASFASKRLDMPRNASSLSGKCCPMSPRAAAPKSASMTAWTSTSASEWTKSPFS